MDKRKTVGAGVEVVVLSRADLESILFETALKAAEMAIRRMPKHRPAQYTKKDAAKELSISRPTLDRLINSGNVRLNECGKVPASEIERIVESRG